MSSKKAIFFYNNFYPAWKAGGPVQSINNLVHALSGKMDISVICSAYDLGDEEQLKDITPDTWNEICGIKAFYLGRGSEKYSCIKKLLISSESDIIYINGLYSLTFVIFPLLVWHFNLSKNCKLILSPRGMLQDGALKVKPLKKRLFLGFFKSLQLHKNIHWHATDSQEEKDIKIHFGNKAQVTIANNIPKKPVAEFKSIEKRPGELRLIYLSLITEKKNLHLALQWIRELNLPLIFDIYGPVKDKKYWEHCISIIKNMPESIQVKYIGEVIPDVVQDTFSRYHALLLPTNGENFGHAIYECLSVGRPVIISKATPWGNIAKKNAGCVIDIDEPGKYKKTIGMFRNMGQAEFDNYCSKAFEVANEYWKSGDFEMDYLRLLS